MPAARLSWRNFSNGLWLKGPREYNPPGTLRRAKSVFPLRSGSVRSRSGILSLVQLTAHSLFKFAGNRIAGVAAQIWREVAGTFTQLTTGVPALNGDFLKFVACPPTSGKPDYVFVAGGGNLFKINPALTEATKWGIDPPTGSAPTATADAVATTVIDQMNASATWSGVGDISSFTDSTRQAAGSAGSIEFVVAKDGEAKIKKNITVDLSMVGGLASGDEDYIELYVGVNRPKNLVSFELIFYVGSAPAGFDEEGNTYSREMTFQVVKKKRKRRLVGTGDFVRNKDMAQFLAESRYDVVDFSTAEILGEDEIAISKRVWVRLTLPKSSFNANGQAGTTGNTWADVKAVQINVEANKQGQSRVWLDRLQLIGGVGMQGTYQYLFTFLNNTTGTRSNGFPTATDAVTGATIFAPVRINDIERQGVTLSGLPNAPADTQVTHVEIWRTVGNGSAFFLVDKVAVGSPTANYQDRVADYPGMFGGGGGTKFLQPEELPDDNDRPDDTARTAIGPVFGRMWLARTTTSGTANRVWYSPAGRFEAVQNFIEVGNTDEAVQALVAWGETLYIVTNRALHRMVTVEEPFVTAEVPGAPGSRAPRTVIGTDIGIIYHALDGVRIFDGNSSQLLGDDALAPIFRTTTNVDGNTFDTGSAAVFARGEYYVSDTTVTTFAYAPDGGWRNIGIPVRAFFWESDTRVLLASPIFSGITHIASFEGGVSSGELSGLVGEPTTDITGAGTLASLLEVETGAPDNTGTAFLGGGVWGLARRIVVEGQTEGQSLTVSLVIDNTVVSVGTISTPVGIKRTMELGVHRWGFIQGVRITAAAGTLNARIEISAIELDVYLPPTPPA